MGQSGRAEMRRFESITATCIASFAALLTFATLTPVA
jgi:hypothetical protein